MIILRCCCCYLTTVDCRLTERGGEYIGHRRITASGRTCKRWDASGYTDATSFPDYTREDAANFCRNPDSTDKGPWCYTTDPDMIREDCNVQKCDGKYIHKLLILILLLLLLLLLMYQEVQTILREP
jgi:hypothetical protein